MVGQPVHLPRRADERGMTLVEVIMSMAMLVGAVFATVSIVDATAHASVRTSERERAMSLAQDALESMRAAPYDIVGIAVGSSGFEPAFEGRATVGVKTAAFGPSQTITVNSVDYFLRRHITWDSVKLSSGSLISGAYKRLAVDVTWGDRTVRLDSGLAPDRAGVLCAQRWVEAAAKLVKPANNYYAGNGSVAAASTVVGVGDPRDPTAVGVAPGDVVLIIQMSGPSAGRYEYAVATSSVVNHLLAVTGVGASAGLVNAYGVGGVFQVIRVPTFAGLGIQSGFGAVPWDGATGGIAAVDVTGDLSVESAIDLSGVGLIAGWPKGFVVSAQTLLPGVGTPKAPGGGLVMVRTGAVVAGSALTADGTNGAAAGGGTIVLGAERGGLESLKLVARGGKPGGTGGHLLLSSDPGASDVAAGVGGAAGTVDTTLTLDRLVGVSLGVGCWPAIAAWNNTGTPKVTADGKGVASYTVKAWNAPNRGTASIATVQDLLPPGFSYKATQSVNMAGGTTRASAADPKPGDAIPVWGQFTIPPGGSLTIAFSASVAAKTPVGVTQNEVRVGYLSVGGLGVSTYAGGFSSDDDVTVTP